MKRKAGPKRPGKAVGLAHLASFPELNPEPVIEVDASGRVHYANPAARALFPDLERAGLKHAWLLGIDGVPAELERRKAGDLRREVSVGDRWYEQHVISVETGRLRIYGRDVTERKRAEEALRASEERLSRAHDLLEAVTERAEVLIATVDQDLRYTFFNRRHHQELKRLTGKETAIGMRLPDVLADMPDQHKAAVDLWTRALGGETIVQTLEFGDPGRHRRAYQVRLGPVRDAAGRVVGAGEVTMDVTELHRVQKALAESERALRTAHEGLERRVAERTEELQKSESLLRSVLETLPIGVWITDKQGRIIMGNPASRQIWAGARYVGVEQYGEYKGWWADTGKPIKAEEWAAARAVTKGETSINEEVEIECFDGTRKFIFNSALPIRDAQGGITGAIIINQDITRRREGESKLREQAALLDLARDAILVRDPEFRITFWNNGARETYGWDAGEAMGRYAPNFLKTRFPEPLEEVRRRLWAEGHWQGELVRERKDGGRIIVESRWAVLPGKDGRTPLAILEISRDITDRIRAEQERLRLATAIEQIADGVAIIDLDGRVLSANPTFGSFHSLGPQEIVGKPLLDILEIDRRDQETASKMREALVSGKVWNWHLTQRTRAGHVRELDLSVSPIRDESGRTIHAIAVERDMTQEILFQERIRQWQKMEALGTLAGGIAHDFNNILLPILINTELILGESTDSAVARRLSQVHEAAQRGKEMVKQIITFSRQKEQRRLPVEIPPIIRESLKLLRVSIPKTIEISEKVETGSAMAVADATQIHQVLMNLGSNAAYAMREKGGLLEVGLAEVSLDDEAAARHIDLKSGPYLRLTVRDTGQGMTPEVMGRVFEPFFTTKKQGEGAGMGLPVVHGIIKSHGGAISVESELGKGTTFTIYLPRVIGTPQASKEDAGKPFPRGTEQVLFVDDEDIQVRAMNKLLEHLGYRVVGLSDSRKALEVFRQQPQSFDLLITDQTMPHMPGIELVREVLRIRPGLPVILCTGYSETLNEEEALAAGVGAFMLKPFSVKEIAEAIRRVLPAGA